MDLARALVIGLTLFLYLSGSAGLVAAQSNASTPVAGNATTTQPLTDNRGTDGTTCDPAAGVPKLSQTRLYAQEKTIEADSPGRIAGGFQADPAATCPVVVNLNLQVPSGMTIQGGSDHMSGGAGMVTSTFEVRPNGGVKDLQANVYSSKTGERTMTVDITYWPKGQRNMAKEIDGLTLQFSVVEPTSSRTITQNTVAGADESVAGVALVPALLIIGGLMAVAIVAIVVLVRNGGTKITNVIDK